MHFPYCMPLPISSSVKILFSGRVQIITTINIMRPPKMMMVQVRFHCRIYWVKSMYNLFSDDWMTCWYYELLPFFWNRAHILFREKWKLLGKAYRNHTFKPKWLSKIAAVFLTVLVVGHQPKVVFILTSLNLRVSPQLHNNHVQHNYHPQTNMWEGYIFTPVYDSIHKGGSLFRERFLCPGGRGLYPGRSPKRWKSGRYAS